MAIHQLLPAPLARLSRRDWGQVFLIWLISVAGAIAYVSTTARIYRVDIVLATVQPDELSAGLAGLPSQLSSLAEIVGGSGGGNAEIALATLTGREFTESFVRDEDLLPLLFPDRWSPETKQWKERPPTPSDAYRLIEFGGIRQLVRDRRSGLITLRLEHSNRELITQMARGMVSRVNQILSAKASLDASASVEYLSDELDNQPLVEVRSSINRLIEAQIKRRMLANVRSDYALTVVDFAGVPNPDDYVRPRRVLIVANAAIAGVVLGFSSVLFRWSSRPSA